MNDEKTAPSEDRQRALEAMPPACPCGQSACKWIKKHYKTIRAALSASPAVPEYKRECSMCNGTGYKDYSGFAMDPCDHKGGKDE